jgi:hypothetical protein
MPRGANSRRKNQAKRKAQRKQSVVPVRFVSRGVPREALSYNLPHGNKDAGDVDPQDEYERLPDVHEGKIHETAPEGFGGPSESVKEHGLAKYRDTFYRRGRAVAAPTAVALYEPKVSVLRPRGRELDRLELSAPAQPTLEWTWKGRVLVTGTYNVTGDCLCNLVGYQTTSAVVNRLAGSVEVLSLKIIPGPGSFTGFPAVSPGRCQLVLYQDGGGASSQDVGAFRTYSFIGDANTRLSGIKVAPALNFPGVMDASQTHRYNVFTVTCPQDTEIEVTIRWTWLPANVSMYTLSAVTTFVGSSPWAGYLDNTSFAGAAGTQQIAHNTAVGDFNAYG